MAHDDATAELRQIKGMERLAHLHEDVVGDIDDVVDGSQADALQALLQPLWARADLDAAHDACCVKWAGLCCVDSDFVCLRSASLRSGGGVIAGSFQRQASECCELATEAQMAEQIRAVRGDLQVKDHIGRHDFIEALADFQFAIKNQQSTVVIANAELLAAAHHAIGIDATKLAFLDLKPTGQNCAGESDGHFVASLEVLGTTNDLTVCAGAIIDLADAEAVCIWVLNELNNLANHHTIRGDACFFDAFNLDAGKGQQVRELCGAAVAEVEVGIEPGEGGFHEGGLLIAGIAGLASRGDGQSIRRGDL